MNEETERILLGQRYAAALAEIDDDALTALAVALEGDLRDAFARTVGLGADAFDDPSSLAGLIRDGVARRRAHHDAGVILAEPCTTHCIDKLGDASEDPTVDELREILPEAEETFGFAATKLMVVQYSRSLKGFRDLIASDERFAVPPPPAGPGVREVDEAAQAAKRAARKERRAREQAAKAKQRGR